MWLLGPVLDRLNSNQKLPIKGDILRYVEGRKLRGLKGVRLETHICCPLIDGTEMARCEDPQFGCLVSGDPCAVAAIKNDKKIKNLVVKDSLKFVNIRKSRSKNSEAALLSRNLYKEEMKRVLNISPEDANQKISNERLRSERARYEDLVFLEDQLSSRKFRIGEVDEKFVKTVQRINLRESKLRLVEKENQIKK